MKYTCKCGQPIEFPPELEGKKHPCPSCGKKNKLKELSAREQILAKVRAESSYKPLRTIIQFCCGFAIVFLLLALLGAILFWRTGPTEQSRDLASNIWTVVHIIIALVVVTGVKFAALMLIDRVDLQINQKASKTSPTV
jgi:cytochrome c biogenesis protein CcdA